MEKKESKVEKGKNNTKESIEKSKLSDRNGRIFELYLAYSFSQELKCKDFVQGVKYSLLEEIIKLENIIKAEKDIDHQEIEEIRNNIIQYIKTTEGIMKNFKDLSDFSSNSDSQSKKKVNKVVVIM